MLSKTMSKCKRHQVKIQHLKTINIFTASLTDNILMKFELPAPTPLKKVTILVLVSSLRCREARNEKIYS